MTNLVDDPGTRVLPPDSGEVLVGSRVLRKEDRALVSVGGRYVADLSDERLAGAGVVTFVRSTVARARLSGIDVSDALGLEGVRAMVSASDLDLADVRPVTLINQAMARPPLARDEVRFVGEPIVAIVSDSAAVGLDAADLVVIDYEPLQAVVDVDDAVTDRSIVHTSAGTNLAACFGELAQDDLFEGCDVVVSLDIENQRLAMVPLEGRSCAASWDGERLSCWLSTQGAQRARTELEEQLGLQRGQVHVMTPDVGGGFGAKTILAPEELVTAWLAIRFGTPMRWTEARTENMLAMGHGRGQRQRVTIGGSTSGHLKAYRLDIVCDGGAYPTTGAFLPFLTRLMAPGPYRFERVESRARSVATNTTPTLGYRGAGRPEATAALERAVDFFAAAIDVDPAQVRRMNFIPPGEFPFTSLTGVSYDSGEYAAALDLVLQAIGYDALRDEQRHRRRRGDRVALGIGLATYVELTGFRVGFPKVSPPFGSPVDGRVFTGNEVGCVEVEDDGGAVVYTGASPHGQGHDTAWSMLVHDTLGIPLDKVRLIHGDTDLVPVGQGTMGSRSLQLAGVAVHRSAVELIDVARHHAAALFEAAVDDVVFDRGQGAFFVAGTPSVTLGWGELAARIEEPLSASCDFVANQPTAPFGAHAAVVEVDTETGKVDLLRMVTVDDSGTVVNPVLAEGQRHGGIAQGIGQALLEAFVYDDDGNPLTATLADYYAVSAPDLPSFELLTMETPTDANPLGVKGLGESGTIGATPAVQNAVVDALAHLGVRHIDMPVSPRRVWEAVRAAQAGPAPTGAGRGAGGLSGSTSHLTNSSLSTNRNQGATP